MAAVPAGRPGRAGHRGRLNRSGWLGRALADHRVLLLDQRGTGRSTPATRQTLARRGDAAAQADYLTHFRADSIVRDAELLRRELVGRHGRGRCSARATAASCAMTYLSLAPEALEKVLVTGGLPPLDRGPDDVYRATFERVRQRYDAARRPLPRRRATGSTRVADHLAAHDVRLPVGRPAHRAAAAVSSALGLGYSRRLGEAALPARDARWAGDELADEFLVARRDAPRRSSTGRSTPCCTSRSTARARRRGGRRSGSATRCRSSRPEARPLLPTGEMIYPWMFEADRALAPLREAAELLAAYDGWPALYDLDRLAAQRRSRSRRRSTTTTCTSSTRSRVETAQRVGNLRWWVTSEFGHDGLRSDARVLDRLLDLAAGDD